jgi:hypothetical protein
LGNEPKAKKEWSSVLGLLAAQDISGATFSKPWQAGAILAQPVFPLLAVGSFVERIQQ